MLVTGCVIVNLVHLGVENTVDAGSEINCCYRHLLTSVCVSLIHFGSIFCSVSQFMMVLLE